MENLILISLISGLATSFGAFFVIALGKPKDKLLAFFLGIAAGIMLAVVVFDLLPASFIYGGVNSTAIGFLLGCLLLYGLDFVLTKVYPSAANGTRYSQSYFRKLGYLIAIGIALHDLPEGMAIAVGYEANQKLGLVIALAVSLHNIPEGMAIAAPLQMGYLRRRNILFLAIFVSIFTPIGTLWGISLINSTKDFIAPLLSLAAGAMTYIIKDELWPALQGPHANVSRLGLIMGFLLILFMTLSSI